MVKIIIILFFVLCIAAVAVWYVLKKIKERRETFDMYEAIQKSLANMPVKNEVYDENLMAVKNKMSVANILCDLGKFRKNVTRNYIKLCKYPEMEYVTNQDKLQILKLIWKNFNSPHKDIVKKVTEKFTRYGEFNISRIVAIETSRITNYMHMQKFLELKKLGLKEFAEYYAPEEKEQYIRTSVRLCHIKDMVKAADIYRKPDDRYSYYIFNYGPIENAACISTVLLFKNGRYTKMTVDEFRKYCMKKKIACPL